MTGGSLTTTTGNLQLGSYIYSTNELNQTAGTITSAGQFKIGQGGVAVYNRAGGELVTPSETMIGIGSGKGIVNISTDTAFQTVHVGRDGGTGVMNILAGSVSVSPTASWYSGLNLGWGTGSKGFVNVAERATLTDTDALGLGRDVGTYAELNIKGAASFTGDMNLAEGTSSTGIVHTAGTLTTPGTLNIANNDDTYGEFTIEGGRTEIGYGVNVGSHSNSTARLYVKGGELVYTATGQWSGDMKFGGKENSDAYVEVTGGCISNASTHAIVINSYPTDSSSGTMVVDGGKVYSAGSIRVGDSYSGTLTVNDGLVEADGEINLGAYNQDSNAVDTVNFLGGTVFMKRMTCTYAKSTKNITINGTTFKAKDDTDDFFLNCGNFTLGNKGMIVNTDGHAVTIQNEIKGTLFIVPGEGFLTLTNVWWGSGSNSSCLLAPAADAEGVYTIKVQATHAEKMATTSADGSYSYAWSDKGDNTYEVTVTKNPIVTATWTNASGDGNVSNTANWTCVNSLGMTVAAIPTADTDVTVPVKNAPDLSSLTVKSVTMVADEAGTTYLRGDCTAPEVMKDAIAWYDPDDATTITKDDDGGVIAMKNKGTAGADLDLKAYDYKSLPTMNPERQINGRGTLTFDTESFGFVAAKGVSISTDSDVVLFAVSERSSTGSKQIFDIELCSNISWNENGLMGIAQWPWYGGRLMVNANTNSEGAATTLVMDDMYNDADTLYIWGEQVGATAASGFCIRKNGEEFQVKNSKGLTYENGRTESGNSEKLHYLYYGMRRENPTGSTGRLAESFAFEKALDDYEVTEIQSYLETKWYTPFNPKTVYGNIVLKNGAAIDFGGGDWTFTSVSGSGTLASGRFTIEKATLGLNDTLTIEDTTYDPNKTTFTVPDGYVANVAATEKGFVVTVGDAKTYEAQIGENKYETLAEAVAAAQAGDTVTLLRSIELTATQTIAKNLTIDLNGFDLTGNAVRVLSIPSGEVALTGSGTLTVTGSGINADSSVIRVGSASATTVPAKLTVGENVKVTSALSYGITVFGSNADENEGTDLVLVMNGTVETTGEGKDLARPAISGNGTNTLKPVAITINGTVKTTDENTVYMPGAGTLVINGTVEGKGGIEIKAGTMTVASTASIKATGTPTHSPNSNGCSTGGFAVAAVQNSAYLDHINVTLDGKIEGTVARIDDTTTSSASTPVVKAVSNKYSIEDGWQWSKTDGEMLYTLTVKTIDPENPQEYDDPAKAEAAADNINSSKSTMIAKPFSTMSDAQKTTYNNYVKATVVSGSSTSTVTLDFTEEGKTAVEPTADAAAAAAIADTTSTEVSISAIPGMYYQIVGGSEPGTLDKAGDAVMATSDKVTVAKPTLDTTTKAFYKVKVTVMKP